MKQPEHPFFRWPGSLLWLLPLLASLLLFWRVDAIGSVWWYIIVPVFVAMTLIDLFTTIWFGILTLVILFIYCSIGSSGAPISFAIWEPTSWVNLREMRGLEMTEFEWFHWWPFKWLIAILCLNMAIVTIRKIKRNILTIGVWTVHGGVIVMLLGCIVYFSQKIEGDVLVSRRVVEIKVPGGEPVSMVATPANSVTIGDTSYTITDINPSWELMSGDDAGTAAYAVTISVQGPKRSFMRQLIAGYPEYTEDIMQSDDPNQPMARAKNVVGTALVDETLEISLQYDSKDTFFVTQSGAIYLRELSESGAPLTPWVERPIENLPRFNDYIAGYDDVWSIGEAAPKLHPLSIKIEPSTNDPVDSTFIVNSYLRYAYMNPRIATGGEDLFPVAWATLRKGDEAVQTVQLYAFDPSSSTADTSLMTFRWLGSESELKGLENSLLPTIQATTMDAKHTISIVPNQEFQQIGESDYEYKIKSIQNNLNIGGKVVSLAIVELRLGDKTWERWVFDNPSMNRDVIEGAQHENASAKFIDDNIKMVYSSGAAPITIVGGLNNNEYRLLTTINGDTPTSTPIIIGDPIPLTEEVTLTVDRAEPYTYEDTRPMVVPPLQRDPSASNMYSMVQVVIPSKGGTVSTWLPYHHYAFTSTKEQVRRFQHKPTVLRLPSGKIVEMLFSRQRAELPAPVALKEFEVDSHIGGFTGSTSSILNWRSIITFLDGNDSTLAVSVNDPKQYGDYWFFQSQWDPPDNSSQGLNYTVLGIGNRHGVFTMLLGCCLTVAGMIWAFYVKPMIKRKRQQTIYTEATK